MSDRILIFDTTLRDGEQCPGAAMTQRQKLEVARQLARLGVDIIEAGFPIASQGDFESVREIARTIRGPVICGLSRCVPADIDAAGAAIKPAGPPPMMSIFMCRGSRGPGPAIVERNTRAPRFSQPASCLYARRRVRAGQLISNSDNSEL